MTEERTRYGAGGKGGRHLTRRQIDRAIRVLMEMDLKRLRENIDLRRRVEYLEARVGLLRKMVGEMLSRNMN